MSTAFQFYIGAFTGNGAYRNLDVDAKFRGMVDAVRDVERKDSLSSTKQKVTTTAPSGGATPCVG